MPAPSRSRLFEVVTAAYRLHRILLRLHSQHKINRAVSVIQFVPVFAGLFPDCIRRFLSYSSLEPRGGHLLICHRFIGFPWLVEC